MISSTYSSMNDNPRRQIQGKVELYNGSTLLDTFLSTDKLQEVSVSRASEHGKFFGYGICQQATVKIVDKTNSITCLKGESLTTAFRANSTGAYERICPTFYIKDAKRDEKTSVITAVAYDALDGAAGHIFAELGMVAPYTIKNVVEACARLLGVSTNISDSAFNLSYEKGANFTGDESIRTVLNAVAEATQTIYYIDHADNLVFKRLSNTGNAVLAIPKGDYFELSTSLAVTLSKIVHVTELGDNVYIGDDTGVCQYVRDNPFWNTRTDLDVVLRDALDRISGLTVLPYDLRWRGNFLTEIGDKISIQAKDDSYVTTFILEDAFTYNGGLSQTTSWEYKPDSENTSAANPATIGEKLNQTFARVDKIEKNITLYVSDIVTEVLPTKIEEALDEELDGLVKDVEDLKGTTSIHTQNITQLQLNSTSITQEVSQLKQSNTTITNELDEIVATQTTIQEDVASLQVNTGGINATVTSMEQTITKLNSEIDDVSEQTNERIDTLSSEVALKLDKEGVAIEVAKHISEGVDKVTTSAKKYTFDDTGLNISNPDSEISTLILEDGMRISKYDKEVLTVNNQGVAAADLHARTFLIIGENSRLEDRGNRTGCFWIGPAGG